MKYSTAIGILNKESIFMGISLAELLTDIEKHGRMVYSEKVVEAAKIILVRG